MTHIRETSEVQSQLEHNRHNRRIAHLTSAQTQVYPASVVTLPEQPRFLSEADCHEIARQLARFSKGGASTEVIIESQWTGNVRWARNLISTSGETQDNYIQFSTRLNGAEGAGLVINETTDVALVAVVRRAERLIARQEEHEEHPELVAHLPMESMTNPQLFHETTYQLSETQRAAAAHTLAQSAAAAGMLSAGYIEVSANSKAAINSFGQARYCQYTYARYSVTVRDPTGSGSGWAGDSWYDWNKLDSPKLSAIALEKCLASRHPVAIEPGRYTTILEPQAVGDFIGPLVYGQDGVDALDRRWNETGPDAPFLRHIDTDTTVGVARLGERVIDPRITISADPMDPELGFPPFDGDVDDDVYHPATWIARGVLQHLAYDREYGITLMGGSTGLPNSGAFRMSGGETSIEDMIATTKRGLLVTRFDPARLQLTDSRSLLIRGLTRDGLWLIENGKVSKPVKNMYFTESILFALNNVDQLGVPQRVFRPRAWKFARPQPVIVPPLKIRDFSFTSITDAI